MPKELFIIRGLPGAGKSTLAYKLCTDVFPFEADTFFTDLDGNYKYDGTNIAKAHKFCQECAESAMIYKKSRVVVSNVFVKRWMMRPYYEMAEKHGYQVTEITVTGPLHESIHGVPQDRIDKMREEWEH